MSYTVRKTNGTPLSVEIADQTINTTETSLALVGRGAVNYGQAHAENFVRLLENFAHTSAPNRPLTGQMWYDTSAQAMKYFDGTAWKMFGGGGAGGGGTNTQPGGSTIGGGVATGNRSAGATGVVIQNGAASSTVSMMIAEGRIIAIAASEVIAAASLPQTITIESQTYALASRFPSGLKAGITLATDPAGYVFHGVATSAQYADVAERYATSEPVEAGDVVEIGGEKEIRKTTSAASTDVFGVISTSPAVRLNEDAGSDETHPFVVLTGRAPVKVFGPVRKGQRLVSSGIPGVAQGADGDESVQAIIGRALEDKSDAEIGLVEVVLGGVK